VSVHSQILARFEQRFGIGAKVYRAPGRVNLIGEHTDYNEGFVLPAAIDSYCWVAAAPRTDGKISLYSENMQEGGEADLSDLWSQRTGNWTDYPMGVAWALGEAGEELNGASIYITGDVPLGSGLSSSAALEIAVGYALLDVSEHRIDRTELALTCQRAENEFVGARCGIMDQFVSVHGQAGCAVMIDCRSLEHEFLRIPAGIRLVVCNSMVKHEHSDGGYNARRSQCEEGVRCLSEIFPGIRALRDVTREQLEENKARLTDVVYRRCRHVISENDRVLQMVESLKGGNILEISRLMSDSHESLRRDFEVSCAELDVLVEIASSKAGAYGARMTGGGFGGCTINLVEASMADDFVRQVRQEYEQNTGLRSKIHIYEASQGAQAAELEAKSAQTFS
jgi:galactokinase